MKLKNILTIILLTAGAMTASAENNPIRSVHEAAHKQQLANAKSRMDKSVLIDFIKQDVDRREHEEEHQTELSSETATMLNDLLSEARSHMGKRYRSGAKGPSAFDCSGFSSYVYRQFGYNLSSSSSAQYSDGVAVEKNALRPGDLVFFKGRNTKRGIGHVGIVVSADNERGTFRFIHASTSQGIKIDGSEGYYSSRYVGARRVITD